VISFQRCAVTIEGARLNRSFPASRFALAA
jgi:hypothetical protein